jgi:hypothetical protein
MKIKLVSSHFLCFIFFSTTICYSQSIPLQSINGSATVMNENNHSINFIVGELAVFTDNDNQENSLSGGFTNATTLTTLSIQENKLSGLNVLIYPNPTTDVLQIKVNNMALATFSITLNYFEGETLYAEKFAGISNTIGINTQSFPNGTYLLSMEDDKGQLICVHKIIKK